MFCLNDISFSTDPTYTKRLISSCHLYSVVNDYDISKKLSLNLSNHQLKYESFGRKLWYVLQEMSILNSDDSLYMMDNLKSLIILTHLDNILLDEQQTWGKISQLLLWVAEILEQGPEQLSNTSNGFGYPNLTKSVSLTLYKIYILCSKKEIVSNFDSVLNIEGLMEKSLNEPMFPLSIKCTLAVILNHIELHSSLQITNKFSVDFMNYQYSDTELNELKAKLTTQSHASDLSLDFVARADFEYREVGNSNNGVNDVNWIRHIRTLIRKHPKELETDETMYTLITALSNFLLELLQSIQVHAPQIPYKSNTCTQQSAKVRPPLKSTTESLILDEIIKSFYPRMQLLQSNLYLVVTFFLMIYNYYANYLPLFDDGHENLLDKMLNFLSTHPNRNFRMLIIRILPLYLIQDTDDVTLDRIFKFIFQRITTIDFKSPNRRHFGESTIYALVELARVCNGERLCAVYFKLVDWLGEPNDQHLNYVYCGF